MKTNLEKETSMQWYSNQCVRGAHNGEMGGSLPVRSL